MSSRIPAHGMGKEEVARALERARAKDLGWRTGRAFAYVYDGGSDIEAVAKHAYTSFLTENGLDPTVFPSLLTFENDLSAMARAHLGGDDEVVGNFTSGGTESIVLAVKTAREWYRASGKAGRPELVVPTTAHAAFFKAAHYLDVDLVAVDVDPKTFRADPAAMRAAVTDRTMQVVASASSYAHGVVDPVTEIAAIAAERGVLCHVDGCIGGFLLPYFRRLGADVPPFDFSVPGVTSMSMDFHKYALCPKGASIVLHRSKALRRHQIYACSGWTGYTMVNTTVQSSKSGGPLAAAWAVLHHVGDDGYMRIAEGLLRAKDAVVAGIARIPGLRVLSSPEMSLVAFASEELSVFQLADAMKRRGWYIQPQLGFAPSPPNVHLSIQPSNVPHVGAFLVDLAEATAALRGAPRIDVAQLAEALVAQLEADPSYEALGRVVAMTRGSGDGPVPAEMAETNHLLDALPPRLRERLLVEYVNEMFTPTAG